MTWEYVQCTKSGWRGRACEGGTPANLAGSRPYLCTGFGVRTYAFGCPVCGNDEFQEYNDELEELQETEGKVGGAA